MVQTWTIVGGTEKGGILVRTGRDVSSPAAPERLSTGAKVEELALDQGRIQYKLLSGTGPATGWITVSLKGKALAEKDSEAIPPLPATGDEPEGVRAARVARSRKKLHKRKEGEKELPGPVETPARLKEGVLGPKQPYKKITAKDLPEVCKQNLPGMLSGMPFPHTPKQLEEFGAAWITKAFHKFKSLPESNSVKRLVSVDLLPLSGFDTCGGAGAKAFFTVEYEKEDPTLHTRFFAKFPWDPHGRYPGVPESTPGFYRQQISVMGPSMGQDIDWMEIFTSCHVEHLLPFPIPKFYFGDLCRETTNFIFIVECLPFGRRGRVENGKVVEEIRREPFDMLPVCGKYQDFLLDDPGAIYCQIFRMMAQVAAWDQRGRFDHVLGPIARLTTEEYLAAELPKRKKWNMKRKQVQITGAEKMVGPALDFAQNIASCLFSKRALDKKSLTRFREDASMIAPYHEDIKFYTGNSSDYVGVAHLNLQADNAFFWRDENGELDGGVLDWSGFSRPPNFVSSWRGCLIGAEADLLLQIEETLMKIFADEYERFGGPHLEWQELLLRWHLTYMQSMTDTCRWIEMDTLREMPAPEWKGITSRFSDKFMNTWNVRTRTTTFINLLEYWAQRDMRKIFQDWQSGPGKQYMTVYAD